MIIDVQINKVWSFDDLPPGVIALDGACIGPRVDPEGGRYSFDHHGDCVRLSTLASCEQVFDALLLGLDPSAMTVLVNDVDADTVLATWLLQHHQRWRDPVKRRCVRALVATIGRNDAHGPTYPLDDPVSATYYHRVVLAPRTEARQATKPIDGSRLLEACLANLEAWWHEGLARGESVPAEDKPPPTVKSYTGWVLAEVGRGQAGGCMRLYAEGHDRVVLCSRRPDGRYSYTVARRSDFVGGFPMQDIFTRLNKAESLARAAALNGGEKWGGSSTIGGAPHDGSVLSPAQVAEQIEVTLWLTETLGIRK